MICQFYRLVIYMINDSTPSTAGLKMATSSGNLEKTYIASICLPLWCDLTSSHLITEVKQLCAWLIMGVHRSSGPGMARYIVT